MIWRGDALSEIITEGPLSQVQAFALLIELMRTLETLHAMGISYGALNIENVIIDRLSPLRFVLANLSYACKHANNFDIHHETDVRMAVQTVLESSPKTFPQDPVARSIFEDLQSKMRKRLVLAKEFQHAFDPITVRGGLDYPFFQTSFNRKRTSFSQIEGFF